MQSCQLTQELIRRIAELETENTRLLKEEQGHMEKMNAVYAQLLAEQNSLVGAKAEVKKLEQLLDEAHRDQEVSQKVATEALDQADEARKKEQETAKILAESIATFDEERGKLVQQGYDACYEELKDEYTKMADDSYTNGYEEAYRLAWKEALKATALSEESELFKEANIVWPSDYVPKPLEDEDKEVGAEAGTAVAEGVSTTDITGGPVDRHIPPVAEDLPPSVLPEPKVTNPTDVATAEGVHTTAAADPPSSGTEAGVVSDVLPSAL